MIHSMFRDAARSVLLGSTAILFTLAGGSSAWAADAAAADAASSAADAASDDDGGAIVVTARHREEVAQDVPIALSVVSADTLEKRGDFTLNQIQQQIPSVQLISTNPRNTNINIRGLGANSSLAVDGLEYGVGFYLDGVYYGRPGPSTFDLVDLERLEVLRGPQGTLFGKNTTAGAINVSSREPSFTPEGTAEAQVGDYDYYQVRGSVSGPLTDKIAVRLSVSDTHRGGFLTNLYDNSKAQDYQNFSVRGQLLIKPTDNLKIRIIGDYSHQKQHYILSLLDGYFSTYANGATIPFNILQRAAATGYTLPTYGAFARLGNSNSPYQANMETYGGSGQVDWDIGPATITSITAYRWWDWYPLNDVDSLALSVNLKGHQQNFQRQFSQELRIASNGTHFLDYQAGLYYFWQKVPGYGATQYGSDAAAFNLNPATVPAATIALANLALTNAEADSFSNAITRSYAVFGQVDAHLTSALTLTAGLRFTHEDKSGVYQRAFVTGSGVDLSGLNATQLATVSALRTQFQLNNTGFATSDKDNALGGLVTLSYKVTPDVLVYGTYSRGSKSGGLNITAGGQGHALVAPEKVDNFEIGLKSQMFDHSVTFNAAGYLTNVKDYQANITEFQSITTSIQYISNIPKVRSKGAEADLSWQPVKWVDLTGSLAYTDAKYVTYTNAPAAPERANLGPIQDLSGVALPGVSKWSYSLSGDAFRPIDQTFEAYVHGDYSHRSSFNSSGTNSIYGIIPAYGIVNAKIGLRTTNGKYDVSLWAKNLTNKDYYFSRGGGAFGLITGALGDPRTFGATLRVKY